MSWNWDYIPFKGLSTSQNATESFQFPWTVNQANKSDIFHLLTIDLNRKEIPFEEYLMTTSHNKHAINLLAS